MLSDSDPASNILIRDILLIVVPIIVTFILNLACAAAIYMNDAQHAADTASGDKSAQVLERLLRKSDRMRAAVKLCSYISVVLTAAGWLALLPTAYSVWVRIAVLVLHPLLFNAVCILSPRRIAAYSPQSIAYGLCGILRLWCIIAAPAAAAVECIGALSVRLTGHNPHEEPTQVTEEEIRMLVDEGEESGAINTDEKKMINNIFEFDDRGVAEVMTHRTEVHAVPVTATLHEAVELAMHCGNTRLPVYEDDIDNICGVLYAKDLLRFLDNPDGFSTRDVMREPLYVPETCSCADVFTHMQQQRTQFAVVVDEYGGTYGIVTMEDLLETIVGTIEEEYNEAESGFTPAGDNVWLLDASLGLSEVEVRLDIRFPDDSEADTIGGYLAEQLGYDRSEGAPTSVTVDNYRFSIAQSDDRRIHTVRAERLPEESEEK